MLDPDGRLVVLSCDPITSASVAHLGRLTVHVSCNDAAAAGAEPVGLLVTLLMPPDGTHEELGRIADDIAQAARIARVDILGGHTEVTDAVTRPVTSACVIALRPRENALPGMRPGDAVVLTKSAAVEGTAILAEDYAHLLLGVPEKLLASARALAGDLSVVPESAVAMQNGATAMHDVTEGGVLGAAWELAFAGGCAVAIDSSRILVRPDTDAICRALGLDPLRLLGSGGLLIAASDGARMLAALSRAGISAAIIGHAVEGAQSSCDGLPLEEPHADEIYRLSDRV